MDVPSKADYILVGVLGLMSRRGLEIGITIAGYREECGSYQAGQRE